MQVSVETLEGLGRKVTVTVPKEKFEEEFNSRLKSLAKKVKMDGYRPGKVPLSVVEKRYADSLRYEIATDFVQPTLFDALKQHDLEPVAQPQVEIQTLSKDTGFSYTASFEVSPTFVVVELKQAPVELIKGEVTDKDVDELIEKLRKQNTNWVKSTKKAQMGDKVTIDFEGYMDDTLFEGGSAKDHSLVLGSGAMIPGFEEGIVGASVGKTVEVKVPFPKDYHHEKLAGKKALFKITVKEIFEGELPALDDDFATLFNIKKGGLEALKKDVKDNMSREMDRQIKAQNKDILFDKLMSVNHFEVPVSLIDREIEELKHEMYHRMFGHEHKDDEKIPDFPRDLFEEQAKKRAQLGILFTAYVKKHEISATTEAVNAMIDTMAEAYESPDELRKWYLNNQENMLSIQALVLEQMVADKIASDAKVTYVKKDYDAVMNPKKAKQAKGE